MILCCGFLHCVPNTLVALVSQAHVIEITKACIAAFMKARNSLVVCCRERKKTEDSENAFFYKLLLKNMEMLLMADLLPNGLHEKVMICFLCYITKSKIPLKKFNR